jgi:putative transposase
MQLVEQHVIDRKDPRYSVIDEAAFKSKNLYNAALYEVRQAFIHEGKYLNYSEMDHRMQSHEADPSKFTGRPRLPKYKHKTEGRNILVYTVQALSQPAMRDGLIRPSGLPITIETEHTVVDQVRIVPRNGHYVVEIVYTREPVQANVDPSFCVGIDLGVTNLAAIASNREGFAPRLVNGRPVKAWNQWYNKRMKELKKQLPKEDRERVTKQMERITNTRNRRISHYLHTASKRVIDFLVKEGVGTVIIGKNPLWKQETGMGKRNNQNFGAPHQRRK